MIEINQHLSLAQDELVATATRGGGPGGQNVNKVATRVTLWFDVEGSPSLNEDQRQALRERLATRIGKDGRLRVTSRKHRTQAANRAAARERFVELVREALLKPEERRATRVPKRTKRKRLDEKRRRSAVKKGRSAAKRGMDE